jgi:hypothetical protein
MSSQTDLTVYDAALKQHYTADKVENLVYKDNPLYAMLPKMEAFGGRNLPIPIIYGNPQGRSRTFSQAQARSVAAAAGIKITDFILTRVKDYSVATIDNETLEASKGDANSFISAATSVIDGAYQSIANNYAFSLYRGSSGARGRVLAEPTENASTFSFTLLDIEAVTGFEVGQEVVMYAAESGGSAKTSDGSDDEWTIAGVNRTTGVITLTGTYSASGDIAANDYVFVNGDRGLSLSGFQSWVPFTAPDSTLFFGVDRSVDVTRLGGNRLDATGLPIEEALIEADAMVAREGFGLTHYFMGHDKFGDLKKALGSKVQYVDVAVNAKISFRGVMVDGTRGPIKVIPDHNCPGDLVAGMNMNYVKLYSLGKAVRTLDMGDGLEMLRQAADDGVEARIGGYAQLGIRAPGAFINVKV